MTEDGLLLSEILQSLAAAVLVEDYPDAWKGATVLLLHEYEGRRFHVIWGLSKANAGVATLITAYVPDPHKWDTDLKTRVKP